MGRRGAEQQKPMTPEERNRYLYEKIREGIIQALVASEMLKYWEANPPPVEP